MIINKNILNTNKNILNTNKINELANIEGGEYFEKNDQVIKYVKEKALVIDPYLNSDIFLSEFKPDSIFYGLDISMRFGDIQTIFNQRNYIQLRPYNGEKILVIGCGNKRIDSGGLKPYLNNSKEIKNKKIFDIYHSHHNEFTIDLSLLANPSIIGKYNSETKFLTIPNGSFDLIYFEGGGKPEINPNEIKRLLNNKTTSFCIGMADGFYYIYSYYGDGIYHVQ